MLDHISIGTRDIAAARAFYDVTLAPLGASCKYHDDSALGYGSDRASFWVLAAKSPVPADTQSGLHICFQAKSRAAVDGFYRSGLAAGGRDNGAPGIRTQYSPNYYAAFVIDPDGYRIEAYVDGPV